MADYGGLLKLRAISRAALEGHCIFLLEGWAQRKQAECEASAPPPGV